MPKKKKSKKKKTKKTKKKKSSKKRRKIKRVSKTKRSTAKRSKKKNIDKTSSNDQVIKTKPEWVKRSLANKAQYQKKYSDSIKNNNSFWKKEGKRITWIKPYKKIKDVKYSKDEVRIKWFEDGTLNASANCIDRHLKDKKDKTAIIWVGDDPKDTQKISYKQLHQKVSKAANGLKKLGIQKGDRVTIYLTMIPELAILMLACARIGAVHSIIFGGFSAESISGRVNDCKSEYIITADEGVRGGKTIPLKATTDEALSNCPDVKKCIVVKRTGNYVYWDQDRDVWYHDLIKDVPNYCEPEEMNAEDPLFILYTSGSTGKPKGVLHTTGGYMVYTSTTHHYIFDYHPGDVYWCTADIGWITGHSYILYGPMANRATTMMYEGVPNYPDYGRFWEIVEKHKVNIFYTAPTALRALMKEGSKWPNQHNLESLKILGTVGEPIKEPEWLWYYNTIGNQKCPIVDTWWQTETGSIMITPLPGITSTKPGSACGPMPGIDAVVVDENGNEVSKGEGGYLAIKTPWPSMLRTVFGDEKRYIDTYWSKYDGMYFAGDGAKYDDDGYFWLLGRVDDVMNISGHRISTAEVESALVAHESVAEAAVIGRADEISGEAIAAFVTLIGGFEGNEDLISTLRQHVSDKIGPIAKPKSIVITNDLPKTRSGKIMRRLLKDISEERKLGDVTTLANADIVSELQTRSSESSDE